MTRPILSLLLAASLAGCANVHHVEVGAIPDDYRTRHPIVVAEGERHLEIPIASSDMRLGLTARSQLSDFASQFRRSNASMMRVMVPVGTFNEAAAHHSAQDAVTVLAQSGVAKDRVILTSYPAGGLDGPVPLRFSFNALTASVAPCGRWPEDLGNTHENRNYFNFGCASQQNLAAQIADPRDLLGPRGVGEIDAERRSLVIRDYRAGANTTSDASSGESNYDW